MVCEGAVASMCDVQPSAWLLRPAAQPAHSRVPIAHPRLSPACRHEDALSAALRGAQVDADSVSDFLCRDTARHCQLSLEEEEALASEAATEVEGEGLSNTPAGRAAAAAEAAAEAAGEGGAAEEEEAAAAAGSGGEEL